MAPTPKTLKRKRSLQQYVSNRNKQSVSMVSMKKRKTAQKYNSGRNLGKREGHGEGSGSGARQALVKSRYNKKVSLRPSRKVKVSKTFKLKVNKALQPRNLFGRFCEIQNGSYSFGVNLGNQQRVDRLCPGTGSDGSQMVFTPIDVLDAASILFNSKTPATIKATTSGNNTVFSSESLDPRSAIVNVVNSSYHVVLRNNSRRTWIIQLYEASPKMKQNANVDGDVVTQWKNTLNNEGNVDSGNPKQIAINVLNLTKETTLYSTPQNSYTLKKYWNFERHDIVLDPGQSYDHNMQGPSNVEYDFSKFWKSDSSGTANEFLNIQPGKTRALFFTARLDLVSDSTDGEQGRWGSAYSNERLIVEEMKKFTITMPQQSGGAVTTTGDAGTFLTQNTQARNCYYHRHWDESTVHEEDIRVDNQTATNNA
nr:MAG: putative capsid protein [Arizlama virus]